MMVVERVQLFVLVLGLSVRYGTLLMMRRANQDGSVNEWLSGRWRKRVEKWR